jgi:hypothetical protein
VLPYPLGCQGEKEIDPAKRGKWFLQAIPNCRHPDHSTGFMQVHFLTGSHFPSGGMGAGMVCLEGTGCISHVSVRNMPDIFNEPMIFGAVSVKGVENGAKVLEGSCPFFQDFRPTQYRQWGCRDNIWISEVSTGNFKARFPIWRGRIDWTRIFLSA